MIVFNSGFDIKPTTKGADKICPVPLKGGKFYLSDLVYNNYKPQIDKLGIILEKRPVDVSEYIIPE